TIADGGRTLVSGRLLADITKALPAQPVEISVDGSRASIICGSARFSLPTMPVEDYPQLPHQPALAGEVAGDSFSQAVNQVAIADGGRTLVSGRLLAAITKALPAQPVEISVDGSRASIICGSARFSLPTMPVEDYPQLPHQPALAGEVAGDSFSQAVNQVAIAAGKDDTLPMLTGMRIEISGSTLTLVATDRFRLAMREFAWQPAEELDDAAVLVPARTLAEAAKSLGSTGSSIRLALASGDGLLGLTGSGRETTTRLLDAEFPPYRKLLPDDYSS